VTIGIPIYTAVRARAVAKRKTWLFAFDGTERTLRFEEMGGKSRETPAVSKLAHHILECLDQAGLNAATRDTPSFRMAYRKNRPWRDMQWQASTWAAWPIGG
jgi:hypothetical protein